MLSESYFSRGTSPPGLLGDSEAAVRQRLQSFVALTSRNPQLPLHPRRSLDQYYYSSLGDTTARDRDQTVSKWTGTELGLDSGPGEHGRDYAVHDSLMLIVDQVWAWALENGNIDPAALGHGVSPRFHRGPIKNSVG